MKICYHYRFLLKNKGLRTDIIKGIIYNSILSLIALCLYLLIRESLIENFSEQKIVAGIMCVLLASSFFSTVASSFSKQEKALFLILQFKKSDFLIHLLVKKSADMVVSAVLISMILQDFNLSWSFILNFVLICTSYVLGIALASDRIKCLNMPKLEAANVKYRITSKSAAYFHSVYFGEKRVGIWLCPLLTLTVMVGALYLEAPFSIGAYIVGWIALSGIADLAVNDENHYYLNILLKRTRKQLVREKFIHTSVRIILYVIIYTAAYMIVGGRRISDVFMFAVLITVYNVIVARGYTEYIYSFYPEVKWHNNAIALTAMLFALPGVGLLFSLYMLIMKKARRHA